MNFNIDQNEVRGVILAKIKEDDKLKKLTNLNAGSKWMLIINASVWAIVYFIQRVMSSIYDAIFIDSSDRYSLIRKMNDEGMSIKGEEYAAGIVRIGSSTLPLTRIDIPQGAFVKTESGYSYEILEGGYIDGSTIIDSKGSYTIPLKIKAAMSGLKYNVQSDAINQLETSIDEIDVIYNPNPITGGQDIEDTESIRNRLIDAKKDPGRGTMTWFKSHAESFQGVSKAIVIPRYAGRGTVGLLITGVGGIVENSLLQDLSEYFNNDENDPAGAYYVIPVAAQYFVCDYIIKIWYDSAQGIPADADLRNAVERYFATLSPGQKQVLSVIESYILQTGVKDVKIISPDANVDVSDYKFSMLGNTTWHKEVWNG
ncbi:MAG: baseplate J/gp47 family protein [Leptospirales bacterium]|nr:baseplate J/gp47 family protein [Leptospirales bacterium]